MNKSSCRALSFSFSWSVGKHRAFKKIHFHIAGLYRYFGSLVGPEYKEKHLVAIILQKPINLAFKNTPHDF